jgi:hypothetical protein
MDGRLQSLRWFHREILDELSSRSTNKGMGLGEEIRMLLKSYGFRWAPSEGGGRGN